MAEEGDSPQLTFNVKSSSDAKYVLTLPASTTVADLKNKLSSSEYADIPAARQRLIYSGRVLKDPDTLASYKIKDGNTVHLVKGAESNQRQQPGNQGGVASPSGGQANPAANVPTNIAAGTGSGNPLAQLTGARYAGFHGLPGMDTFGADGGVRVLFAVCPNGPALTLDLPDGCATGPRTTRTHARRPEFRAANE